MEYAYDVDFICDSLEKAQETVQIAAKVLEKFNLQFNQSKTDYTIYHKDTDRRKTKRLGTTQDEFAEYQRRKQLAKLALLKYRKIWKNRYINVKDKMTIYNVYVRSILLYNSSTWVANKSTNTKNDSFHRKQLRTCLDIRYHKIIKSCNLYNLTKQTPNSETVARSLKAHLRHVLIRQTPTRDILEYIVTARPVKKPSNPPNIIETYNKDLGTKEFRNWYTMALAKRL